LDAERITAVQNDVEPGVKCVVRTSFHLANCVAGTMPFPGIQMMLYTPFEHGIGILDGARPPASQEPEISEFLKEILPRI
jgi:hypothetical protein